MVPDEAQNTLCIAQFLKLEHAIA
ncbi:protein of unknown function [Enterobacter cancerogenus]|nr:protein of unknown function [Enterobacter cancerogenus]